MVLQVSGADGYYGLGQSLDLFVLFSEPAFLLNTSALSLCLDLGPLHNRLASYLSGNGTNLLKFHYVISSSDTSSRLCASSLISVGTLIVDKSGQLSNLTLPGCGSLGSLDVVSYIVVDSTAPFVLSVTSSPSSGTFKADAQIMIFVNFSEPVLVTGNATLQLWTRLPGFPGPNSSALLQSVNGTVVSFLYTVVLLDKSSRLTYTSTSALTVGPTSSITDLAGNPAVLDLPDFSSPNSLGGSSNLMINSVGPCILNIQAIPDHCYHSGESFDFIVSFSGPTFLLYSSYVNFDVGSLHNASLPLLSGNGTSSFYFHYVVNPLDASDHLCPKASPPEAAAVFIDSWGIVSDPTLFCSLLQNSHTCLDSTPPFVAEVRAEANGSYPLGSTLLVDVVFSERVWLTAVPTLLLNLGAANRSAVYVSGNGTSIITFSYSIQLLDGSSHLSYADENAFVLPAGSVFDIADNLGSAQLPAPFSPSSLYETSFVLVDSVVPVVLSLTISPYAGAFSFGAVFYINITFSKVITFTNCSLLLSSRATPAAFCVAGAYSTVAQLLYSVAWGDTTPSLRYVDYSSSLLGDFKDLAGNIAVLTLPSFNDPASFANTSSIWIDAAPPVISSISAPSGTYGCNDPVTLSVTFSEPVYLPANTVLSLSLSIGKTASYVTGNATSVLTFSYVLVRGDVSGALDITSVNLVVGSLPHDVFGDSASLYLPYLNLAASSSIVCSCSPTVSSSLAAPNITRLTDTDLVVSWNAPDDGGSAIDLYRVELLSRIPLLLLPR